MRQIGLRQFQQNLHKELQDLPVTITKKGIPLYVVTSYYEGERGNLYAVAVDGWEGQCQAPNQHCRQFGKKYVVTFDTDDGEQTIESYLCPNHLTIAKQQALSVEEAA